MTWMKLPKTYDPAAYETDIYALWEKSEAFAPTGKGNSYSVVVPPPNANGNLHIGHALTLAIEDIAVRHHRMNGARAVLLPGADHAGFETQVVYEKQLAKEGKSRFDFGREELYANIYDFVRDNRANFENQFRRIGAGVDWSRFTFTLDDKVVGQAYKTFKKLWDEGLIYRGERLVNYCTFHRTGFADIEVVHEDAETPLYYIKYGPFTLATTRPETKFGDTAVAVHPNDDRYKQWVGKTIEVEGVNGPFEVMVVADEMVDPNFGTGVVKVTPAHSFDDWDVAQRHGLPAVRVINHDGTMNHHAGRFEGMTVLEAREAVVKAMEEQGLLDRVDRHYKNRVGKCYKCGTIIEPMLMEQWFLKMEPLAKPAIERLKNKEITFYPDSKRTQLITYLENLRDWNLSRQIAWGIPIPAFQNVDDSDDWIFDTRVDQEIIEVDGKTYHRDADVFDTWFSSSSWPYVTTNYPEGQDFKDFYPLSVMETGGEILYPWVSRMLMLGLYITGDIPFKSVYIHGYVMAEDGAKMSKSLGNVINPIDVIDTYGSDALRMGIITGRVAAVNRGYDHRKVEDARNFCNKVWNVARFIEDIVGDDFERTNPSPHSSADHWVLHKLQQVQSDVHADIEQYRIAEAYERLYHFVWDDVADWYIEASKASPNKPLLAYLLESTLLLLHPFAPFVTETIWQTLAWEPDSILATRTLPRIIGSDNKVAAQFSELQTMIGEIRFILKQLQVSGVTLYHNGEGFIAEHADIIKRLSGVKEVREVSEGTGLYLTDTTYTCWLDIDSGAAKAYAATLQAKQDAQARLIAQFEARLANKQYVQNAPRHVVDQTREQIKEAKIYLEKLATEQKRFSV